MSSQEIEKYIFCNSNTLNEFQRQYKMFNYLIGTFTLNEFQRQYKIFNYMIGTSTLNELQRRYKIFNEQFKNIYQQVNTFNSYLKNISYMEQTSKNFADFDFKNILEIDGFVPLVDELRQNLNSYSDFSESNFIEESSIDISEEDEEKMEDIIENFNTFLRNLNIEPIPKNNKIKRSKTEKFLDMAQKFNTIYIFFKYLFELIEHFL